jgi:hypothetical protein
MFNRLISLLSGSDPLIQAGRSSDRKAFARLFGSSTVTFIQLPPGMEDGLSPDLSQEQVLELIRHVVRDLKDREEFMPFHQIREGRTSMLLFTQQRFVDEFVQRYVRRVKRIMPFQMLTVQGSVLARAFGDIDTVVLNPESKQEYEVPIEDMPLLRKILAELPGER